VFNIVSSSNNCPSATCASAANVVCRDFNVLGNKTISLCLVLSVVCLYVFVLFFSLLVITS
jgi:hypothetical protein